MSDKEQIIQAMEFDSFGERVIAKHEIEAILEGLYSRTEVIAIIAKVKEMAAKHAPTPRHSELILSLNTDHLLEK